MAARIREWSKVPIIVLSVPAAEYEKVAALARDGDDYVTRPSECTNCSLGCGHRCAPGARTVRRRVRVASVKIKLFAILRLLAQHAGRIVIHQHLLREVWVKRRTHYLRIICGRSSATTRRSTLHQ